MSILVRMAEIQGAEEMLDISGAHIDSTLYQGDATLEFAEHLAELGAEVTVPSSVNVSGVDESDWREWAVPEEWAMKAYRQMQAYQRMGCTPTWTCAPYQTAMRPRFGQQIAWGESNAIAFANSVIGARTERYPDLMDICAAITGRVPALGLHLDENRRGELLLELTGVPRAVQEDDTFCTVLGYLMGKIAQERVPVIDRLDVEEDPPPLPPEAFASSGHVVALRVEGDSMSEAGILSGDYAIIRRQPEVENGQVAAVSLDGEGTLKVWRRTGRKVSLEPRARGFDAIRVGRASGDVRVFGRLVGVARLFAEGR